jgi:DNA-binding Lrp family transcriptional regulator
LAKLPIDWVKPGLARLYKRMKRLPIVIDAIQYRNPPHIQRDIERETDVPQTTVSRMMRHLNREGIRFRVDYNVADFDLNLSIASARPTHRIAWENLPYKYYIGLLATTLTGELLIIYRHPDELEPEKLKERLKTSLKTETVNLEVFNYTALAKPSITYYLENLGPKEKLDPAKALKLNERHPSKPYTKIIDLIKPLYKKPIKRKYRVTYDQTDLFLVAMLEKNTVMSKQSFIQALREQLHVLNEPEGKAMKHFKHIEKRIRGSRAMILDTNKLLSVTITGTTTRRCALYFLQEMVTYFYAINLAIDDNGRIAVNFSLPPSYIQTLIDHFESRCKFDDLKVYVWSANNIITSRLFPFRNYDFFAKKWILDERVLEEHHRKLISRGYKIF